MSTTKNTNKDLSPKQRDELLAALKARFDANMARHQGLVWAKVQSRLCGTDKLWSLAEMERTGGEPDVVGVKSGEFVFMDCAPESPAGQRSVCYDHQKLAVANQARSNPESFRGWRGQFTSEFKPLEFEGFGIVANSPQLEAEQPRLCAYRLASSFSLHPPPRDLMSCTVAA